MNRVRLLETSVTSLEMRKRPGLSVGLPDTSRDLVLRPVPLIPLSFYRYLYDQVGRTHHWTSRLLPDEALRAEVHLDGVTVFVLYADAAPAGWFEVDTARRPGEARIVHFGLLPEFQGLGLARYLLWEAVDAAFQSDPEVVTLETNTLDHPAALPLYKGFGFVPMVVRSVTTRAIDD